MNLIWLLLQESKWQVILAILTGGVSGICSARLIALINETLAKGALSAVPWQFVGLTLVVLVTGPIAQTLLIALSQDAVYRLRMQLSRRILAAPLRQLEEQGVNRLLATLTDDVATLSTSIFVVPFLCIDVAIIISCLGYLATLSGLVFGATLLLMGLSIASVQILLKRAQRYLKRAREEQDQLMKHFQSITAGIKELKLNRLRRQQFLEQELAMSADLSRRDTTKALNLFAIATAWGQLLFFLIIGLLLFALPRFVPTTPAVLSGYVLTLAYLMTPFRNMMDRVPILLRTNVSLKKIEALGLTLADQAEDLGAGMLRPVQAWKSLELQQVGHTYRGLSEDDRFHLGPMDLMFQPRELVFIVGGNGSGKSTLAKLITGLYAPEKGAIVLDGEVIDGSNREWFRQHFATVFADFYLFDRLLGVGPEGSGKADEAASLDAQALDYLKLLQIDHKVKVEQGRLSTTSLSQGQRKRLALLTAYLDDRPIYLFDEWASDQDPVFRALFYEEILPKLRDRGKLVLAISHDDRYFHLADRVIKLDYGQIEAVKNYA
jgi:putative pyoverdin transport system ATP-binding/permease protein